MFCFVVNIAIKPSFSHQVCDIDKVLDHALIMEDSRVLLDQSTADICKELLFVETDRGELAESALFSLPTIQGHTMILPNRERYVSVEKLQQVLSNLGAEITTGKQRVRVGRIYHLRQ